MKKAIFLILILISVITLTIRFFTSPVFNFLGIQDKSGIKVLSNPQGAQVFIDDVLSGKTPVEIRNLEPKEYKIKIQSDKGVWEGRLKLNPGVLTIVGRDLSEDFLSSAGESLSLEKGKGVTVLSFPSSSNVEIDGKAFGKTPLFADIAIGEHIFTISKQGYLARSIKADSRDGFNLILNVDLAVLEKQNTEKVTEVAAAPKVLVLPTQVGFLRVRAKPSLQALEIARVKPGDELELLEEQPSWDKIKLPDGREGYVSSNFVKKL